jgi:hypothetical protein
MSASIKQRGPWDPWEEADQVGTHLQLLQLAIHAMEHSAIHNSNVLKQNLPNTQEGEQPPKWY